MTAPPGLFTFTTSALGTFERVTSIVTSRGSGITALQLRDAGALARELDQPEPDPERIATFAADLELEPADLEVLTTTPE